MSRTARIAPLSMALVCGLAALAHADNKTSPARVDIEPVRQKMIVLSVPGGNYLALVPFELTDQHVYFGDGKTMHKQKVLLSSIDGGDSFTQLLWTPRQELAASVEFRDSTWVLKCGNKEVTLEQTAETQRALVLEGARFRGPLLDHRPYALARGERGKYYYVDRRAGTRGNAGFRVFTGRAGKLRAVRTKFVVSDSEGDIFGTALGDLSWAADGARKPMLVRGKRETVLTPLPVDRNHYLIFNELGVYRAKELRSPCDLPPSASPSSALR